MHLSYRSACADWTLTVLTRRFLGISRRPSPNASHAGDTPSALASDSSTSTPVWPPFSILAKELGLRSASRAKAAFVSPRSIRTSASRAPIPSVVDTGPSVCCSPSPYPNQPALTPSAEANRARVPTVGMRPAVSISRPVAVASPAFAASGRRLRPDCLRAFLRRKGRPVNKGFGRPRTIDGYVARTDGQINLVVAINEK